MKYPVYLLDDDDSVRLSLSILLATVNIETKLFADPKQLLSSLHGLGPGCLILDIRMPFISGLKLQKQLVEQGIEWPIIIMSGHGDIEACRRAFTQGAIDYLVKPIDEQDLIDAIQKAQVKLDQIQQSLAEKKEIANLLDSLTKRELEILKLIAGGFTSKDMASALEISIRTVDSHRASLGNKLGTNSQAELTKIWLSFH